MPAKRVEKMLLPMADARRTTNLSHSWYAHPAVVLVSQLQSTVPPITPPPRSFFFPCVVLRPAVMCKQDVGAVLKCIQVLYTSILTSGCSVHPTCNICFRQIQGEFRPCREGHSLELSCQFLLSSLFFNIYKIWKNMEEGSMRKWDKNVQVENNKH